MVILINQRGPIEKKNHNFFVFYTINISKYRLIVEEVKRIS